MLITTLLTSTELLHLSKDQLGALVTYCFGIPGVFEVTCKASPLEVRVSFNLTLPGAISSEEKIRELVVGFGRGIDAYPCNCGCGAFISISPCYRQSESNVFATHKTILLSAEEKNMVDGDQNWLGAIKLVRERAGSSLREAKDAVDTYRSMLPTHHPMYIKYLLPKQ